VRLERHHRQRGRAGLLAEFPRLGQDVLVAEVDSVEIADRRHRARR
jgi:hypothetical protein